MPFALGERRALRRRGARQRSGRPQVVYGSREASLDEQPRGGLPNDRPPGSTLPEDRPRGNTGVIPGTRRLRNDRRDREPMLIVGVFLLCALVALVFFVF